MGELSKYIENGLTFPEYYDHTMEIEIRGEINNSFHKYYRLNNSRMKRLQKKFKLTFDSTEKIKDLNQKIHLIIITEGWCGDAAQILPILERICQESENIQEHIYLRDENLELIDKYLTNGSRSIPIIIAADDDGNELFKWGPRPAWAASILAEYKSDKLTKDEFVQEIQKTYNKDKGKSIEEEFINLISQ